MGLQLNQRMGKHANDQEFNVETQIKKDYTAISAKKRQKLIEYVIVKQMTIYKAAKRLDIRHPTAKSIIKSYRKAHPEDFLPSKPHGSADKEFIANNQNQNRSETQQIKQRKKSFPSSQIEHQPPKTALSACELSQYSYLWNPYCIYTPFPWNHY